MEEIDIYLDRRSFMESRKGALRMLDGWIRGEGGAGPMDLIPRDAVTALDDLLGVSCAIRETMKNAKDAGQIRELKRAFRKMGRRFCRCVI